MKNAFLLLLHLLFSTVLQTSHAQSESSNILDKSVEYPIESNDSEHPCITVQEYELLENRCNKQAALLNLKPDHQENLLITPLNWPVKAANGLNDCNFYGISAYVDQNTNAGVVSDYNCGTKTYDGHRGTDISIWPFPFYKMDNNHVEVIAAAAGTIIDKLDGNFDKNCASNNIPANYLVIQHADGSRAIYFHLKKNSLSSKAIGQSVIAGEYLGVVGSSGNSSGPHLHFEVWSGSTVATRIDPFSGPCNTLNPTSWWAAQRPYASHEILKTSVHTTDAVLPACPATETPNETSCFSLPFQGSGLPPNAAKFYIFMRYETAGMTSNLSILNPDSSIFSNWTHVSTSSFNASVKSWTKTLPTVSGTYTFRSDLNGVICDKTFNVVAASITPGGPTNICQGNSVTLNANAASTYLWSTGATTQAINISNSGNYTVTVSNANACTASSSPTQVTVLALPPAPLIIPSGPTIFCQGNSVMLNSSAANTYLWSTGATTQIINVSNSGNYTVTVSNANACTASSSPTQVTVLALPPTPLIIPSG
ncbi:MAG: peptidoglycan DD-metalloendopeptidase family protein, partial [Saprospiraceae bacterium]